MGDPITLFGISSVILSKILSDKASEWIIGDAVGKLGSDGLKILFEKTTSLWSKEKMLKNKHLIKALHAAKINATSSMIMTFSQHLKNRGAKEKNDMLETVYTKWIKEERTTIKKYPESIEEGELYNRIELVLSSTKTDDITSQKDAFMLLVKEEFWKNFTYELGKFNYYPDEELRNFLFYGWKIDGKVVDWFDILTVYFTSSLNDLKDPDSKMAQVEFVDTLLSNIQIETKSAFALIEKAIDELTPLKNFIAQQFLQVEQWHLKILTLVNPQPNLMYDYSDYDDLKQIKTLFKNRYVPLFGREKELAQLNEFIDSDGDFEWWVIEGEGGAGKSRLALDFCFTITRENIVKGFMLNEEWRFFNWSAWLPVSDILIIIDYAATFYIRLLEIFQLLYQRKTKFYYKVKFLLLERKTLGTWWDAFKQNQSAKVIPSIWNKPLKLQSIGSDNVWNIFKFVFADMKTVTPDEQKTIQSFSMIDELCRPLFATFAALSIAAGEDIRGWNKTNLLNAELDRQEVKIWKQRCKDEETLKKIKLFCVLTTLTGGLDEKQVSTLLKKTYKWMPSEAELNLGLFEIIGYMRKNDVGNDVFSQMEPDILGEYFLLREIDNESKRLFNSIEEIIFEAWTLKPAETTYSVHRCFEDFEENKANELLLPTSISNDFPESFYWYSKLVSALVLIYAKKGLFQTAEKYYQKTEDLLTLNNGITAFIIYHAEAAYNLAIAFVYKKDFESAKKYYKVLQKLAENNLEEIYIILAEAAVHLIFYLRNTDIETAAKYYLDIRNACQQNIKIYAWQARAANDLALVYINIGNLNLAEYYYNDILQLATQKSEDIFLLQSQLAVELANNFGKVNKLEKVEYYYNEIKTLSKLHLHDIYLGQLNVAYNLYKHYELHGTSEKLKKYGEDVGDLCVLLRRSEKARQYIALIQGDFWDKDLIAKLRKGSGNNI